MLTTKPRKLAKRSRNGDFLIPAWIWELYTPKERESMRMPPLESRTVTREYRRYTTRKDRERTQGPGWTREQWLELAEQHGGKCLRCGETERLVPDHVIPLKKDGRHDLANIQPLCWRCNMWKGLRVIDFRHNAPQSRQDARRGEDEAKVGSGVNDPR